MYRINRDRFYSAFLWIAELFAKVPRKVWYNISIIKLIDVVQYFNFYLQFLWLGCTGIGHSSNQAVPSLVSDWYDIVFFDCATNLPWIEMQNYLLWCACLLQFTVAIFLKLISNKVF